MAIPSAETVVQATVVVVVSVAFASLPWWLWKEAGWIGAVGGLTAWVLAVWTIRAEAAKPRGQ